ncbi:MAG TPA: hypothetical protein DCM86_12960 [Verrucomicrobiales bacterium]|nr:hypothetical protein [Verrucomicrobiales bacterium]
MNLIPPLSVRLLVVVVLLVFGVLPAEALILASGGGARVAGIAVSSGATEVERFAAHELAAHLHRITGASFPVLTNDAPPASVILVGGGPAARRRFPGVDWDRLGQEEFVVETDGRTLLVAGGRPRGTLYAVSRFLQDECGVRWWTPWASTLPSIRRLEVGEVHVHGRPAFEYRESFWYSAFDADWSWRNGCNGQSSRLTPDKGGRINYKGFVHTFYPLVPPEVHFAQHPEWFSLIKGERSTNRAQLCLTNPRLREFTLDRVRQWLRESPEAGIISVSQNDWYGACECHACKAMDDAEGTHAATMLDFVNSIAEKIEPEFPGVAVDTLAYQYTRKPPKTLRPRRNVIVRLCSIECNFREPLAHPSNAAFADDIRGWSAISDRLYIWDYTTDFGHYVQPHPNWFVLGENLRFFRDHHVRGVFEQGAYQSHGSEMAELRAWVLAQLLWNPGRSEKALIEEFLHGYYGAAAPALSRYLERMHAASEGQKLTCFSRTDAAFLNARSLTEGDAILAEAERAVARDPVLLQRVRLARLPVGYVVLSRWEPLRKEAASAGIAWPWGESRKAFAAGWAQVASGLPGSPQTRVTLLSEGGLTPEKFISRFDKDP